MSEGEREDKVRVSERIEESTADPEDKLVALRLSRSAVARRN